MPPEIASTVTIPGLARALTPNEAAKLLRKSPDWVRARIVAGELAALNLANSKLAKPQYRILPQHLAAFIEKRRAATETKPAPKSKRQPAGAIDFFPDLKTKRGGRRQDGRRANIELPAQELDTMMICEPVESNTGGNEPPPDPQVTAGTTGPVPFADPTRPLKLLWPFGEYADALLAYDDARKAEWAATVAGDANARERAITDKLDAQTTRQRIRDDVVQFVTFALRVIAEDELGDGVRTRLRDLLGLGELESRVSEVEDELLVRERTKVAA